MLTTKDINEQIHDEFPGFDYSCKRPKWMDSQIELFDDIQLYENMNKTYQKSEEEKYNQWIKEIEPIVEGFWD